MKRSSSSSCSSSSSSSCIESLNDSFKQPLQQLKRRTNSKHNRTKKIQSQINADSPTSARISIQEEAAAAYDMAAIEYRGPNAVTNFDISIYADKLKNFQQQMQLANPDQPFAEAQEDKQEGKVEQQHPQEEKQMENSKVPDHVPSTESEPIIVMDPGEEHEHPWNLCLDTSGFNSLPISDIPFEKSNALFPDLFADSGFDDDINFIFDAPFIENEFNLDALSGNTISEAEVDWSKNSGEKDQEALTISPSSSPLTSTSACSNI